jgi:uncharacterized iron-regulated membrane protein
VKSDGLLFKLHLWLGLAGGLLVAAMGLTGSLLVVADSVDAALDPEVHRVEPGPARASLEHVLAGANEASPSAAPRVRMPRRDDGPYEVWTGTADDARVFADPYTGRILGVRMPRETFKGFLFSLHTSVLAGESGEWVTGAGGLLLLVLGVSGVALWWPGRGKVRSALAIRSRASWKRIVWDLHRVLGVAVFAFMALSAVTGLYLIFHGPFEAAINVVTASAARPAAPRSVPREGAGPVDADSAIARAREALPGAVVTWYYVPASPEAPVTVRMKQGAEWHPNGRSFVYLDQYTGEPLAVEDALAAPVGTRIANALYPIHIAEVGGLPHRALLLLVGIIPAFLTVTGTMMWWNRTSKVRRAASQRRAEAKERELFPLRERIGN